MKKPVVVCSVFILLALVVLPVELAAQRKKRPASKPAAIATTTGTAGDAALATRRLEAFDTAWSAINANYFDKTFSGLDWAAVRNEFRPRVRAAKSDLEFHKLLKEMIDRLGKSHLGVILPEYFESLEKAKVQARQRGEQLAAENSAAGSEPDADDEAGEDDPGLKKFGIGVELRMLADQIVITRVEPGSGAATVGLKPGYVVDKINGVSLRSIIDQAVTGGAKQADIRYLLPPQIVESFLNGEAETSVYLTCLDGSDRSIEFTVPRLELTGEAVSISPNLPEQFLRYESRSLDADVGYIKFSAFAVRVIDRFCESLTDFRDKKAIIVDLRGNLGGILGSMIGLSAMLTDKPMTIGKYVSRSTTEAFTVESKIKNFKGRIVLLVDGQSMSAAELFAAGLHGNGRAVVVGEQTGGRSLPATWIKLSTGAVMMYPVADFITPRGTSLEGVGLKPDRTAALDRSSLLRGVDTQLAKALEAAADTSLFERLPPRPKVPPRSAQADGPIVPPPPPKVAATPAAAAATASSDARAQRVIDDFLRAIGQTGPAANASYEARGRVTLGGRDEGAGAFYAARQIPGKFLMIVNIPALGEVREVYNGKVSVLQADYGLDRILDPEVNTARFHMFSPIFNIGEPGYLKSAKYEGELEIEGRMRHVLSATTADGWAVGLSIDKATNLLATYALPGMLYTFNDYKKVGDRVLPFHIVIERVMDIHLDTVTLDPKLDPAIFEKKDKCFDKPLDVGK